MNMPRKIAAAAGALVLVGMAASLFLEKPAGTDEAMARELGWTPASEPQWLAIYEDKRNGCQYYHKRIDQGTALRTRFDGTHLCVPLEDRIYDPNGKPEAARAR